MLIRKEQPADFEAISQVTIAAFNTLPISNNTEQFIKEKKGTDRSIFHFNAKKGGNKKVSREFFGKYT